MRCITSGLAKLMPKSPRLTHGQTRADGHARLAQVRFRAKTTIVVSFRYTLGRESTRDGVVRECFPRASVLGINPPSNHEPHRYFPPRPSRPDLLCIPSLAAARPPVASWRRSLRPTRPP